VKSLEGKAPEPVWESEKIPGDSEGGFGSPVVSEGKVYLYCSWRLWHELTVRKINRGHINRLGAPKPTDLPEGLLTKIESARTSVQRAGFKDHRKLREWIKEWIATNLTEEQKKPYTRFAWDRLQRGERATSLELMKKVQGVIEKSFENQEALNAWYDQNGITGEDRKRVDAIFPKKYSTIEDVVICLNAKDGKTLWRKAYPSKAGGWGSSSTPCVADSKVFAVGGNGTAYCLDALTGEEKWMRPVSSREVNSSFAYLEGKLLILGSKLMALDAETGEPKWEQKAIPAGDSSPVIWKHGGKSYVICGGMKLGCVDAETGEVAWTVKGGRHSTPAVSGDVMVVEHGKGLTVYAISSAEAKVVAECPKGGSRGGSPTIDGDRAYSSAGGDAVCVDTKTGELVWSVRGSGDGFSAPILAKDRLLFLGRGAINMVDVKDGTLLGAAKVPSVRCTSPALADGMLYVRTKAGVECYNLRAAAN